MMRMSGSGNLSCSFKYKQKAQYVGDGDELGIQQSEKEANDIEG